MLQANRIQVTVEAPQSVEFDPKGGTVSIDCRASLENVSEDSVVLHARCSDDRYFWNVYGEGQKEIWREDGPHKGATGVDADGDLLSCEGLTVAPGQGWHESTTIDLPCSKLKDGKIYTVRADSWGHSGEATFVAVKAVAAAPAPKKKKAGKKKAKKKAKKR